MGPLPNVPSTAALPRVGPDRRIILGSPGREKLLLLLLRGVAAPGVLALGEVKSGSHALGERIHDFTRSKGDFRPLEARSSQAPPGDASVSLVWIGEGLLLIIENRGLVSI